MEALSIFLQGNGLIFNEQQSAFHFCQVVIQIT